MAYSETPTTKGHTMNVKTAANTVVWAFVAFKTAQGLKQMVQDANDYWTNLE